MRRLIVALALFGLAAAACGDTTGDIRAVREAITKTTSDSYVIDYVETTADRVIEVNIRVEDAFRYTSRLTLEGVPLMEVLVHDDALAFRLLSPNRWNPLAELPVEPSVARAMAAGDWTVDPAGAPRAIIAGGRERDPDDVGSDPLFDAFNILEYTRNAMEASAGVQRFNKDALDYKPSQDPFFSLIERDQEQKLIRYDVVPIPLPRNEDAAGDRLPGDRQFRRMAVYLKDGVVREVLEEISFETHIDIIRAQERDRPQFLLDILKSLRRGEGEDPVRPRSMKLTVDRIGEDVKIGLPQAAVEVAFGQTFNATPLEEFLPDPAQLRTGAPVTAAG